MREYSFVAVLVLGLVVPGTSVFAAEDSQMIELAMPRPAGRAESVRVQVTTGPLPRGARLAVVAETGEILGAVAPASSGERNPAIDGDCSREYTRQEVSIVSPHRFLLYYRSP